MLNAAGSFTISADDQTDPTIPVGTSGNVPVVILNGFVFKNITQKHTDAGVPFGTSITAVDPGGNIADGFNGTVRLGRSVTAEDRRLMSQATHTALTVSNLKVFHKRDEKCQDQLQ